MTYRFKYSDHYNNFIDAVEHYQVMYFHVLTDSHAVYLLDPSPEVIMHLDDYIKSEQFIVEKKEGR